MEISRRESGDIVILDVNGEIDLYNAPEIKDTINKLIEEKKYNVVINLDKVSYIDSSGIGALISSLSNLKKYQGGLKICNVSGSVRKVFELTKLTSFFEIYDTETEAISAFKK
ncbi:MAG: STAS domain-containing protein [Leptospiraceae bacterium]|nr:STAS domain-containing protein [Leptospiraceae bacterium]MDW7976923.1 STAS domain-containing protein [Leptospiraceae bacterium]